MEATVAPARWTAEQVARIGAAPVGRAPLIIASDVMPVADGLAIWDAWPVQAADGSIAEMADGSSLWMALGAPRSDDPDERHGVARIHLFERSAHGWRHLGPAMPDGLTPGSREWSGSAVLDAAQTRLTLYFTATGRRGESRPSFEQRIFAAEARLSVEGGHPHLTDWQAPYEAVRRDPAHYMTTEGGSGAPGTIKAFRDPAWFRDPADGVDYLLFSGSQAGSWSAFNGVVGIAAADAAAPGGWRALPPLVSADGLNNELERPHLLVRDGLYYLFWSTQAHVFDPAGSIGPTGLYGMVSPRLFGAWEPLNGAGLVFANPREAPSQAYSWLVLPDLGVTSFIDNWGPAAPGSPRRFGGSFAPFLRLRLDGATARLC